METYHILVTCESQALDIAEVDLTVAELKERVICPYKSGKSIVVRDSSISREEILGIKITEPIESSRFIRQKIQKDPRVRALATPEFEARYIAGKGKDVTDQFLPDDPEKDS